MGKVRVQIKHPEFMADTILAEGKALTYLGRVKKSLKDNINATFTMLKKGEEKNVIFDVSGPMPKKISLAERQENVRKYEEEMRQKGYTI